MSRAAPGATSRRPAAVLLAALAAGCAAGAGPGLMTFEEYRGIEHPAPYVVRLAHRGGGELLFFGSRHSFEPSHPQFERLVGLWEEFRPTLAFWEGGGPLEVGDDRDEVIRRAGEPGLVRYLAARDGVRAESPEPADGDVTALLLERFSAEQVKLFYVLRQVSQYVGYEGRELPVTLEEQVLSDLGAFAGHPGLAGPPTNLEEVGALAREHLPDLADWREVPLSYFAPGLEDGRQFTNDVALAASAFRDEHLMARIVEAVSAGERLFAVFGASHAVMQERALRHTLGR